MSSSVHPNGPASSKVEPYIKATLAIPEKSVRIIAAPPDTITQRNVEAMTGIPSRVYLQLIRASDFPLRVTRLGKLRLVNRLAFVAWLEQGALGMESMPPSVPANDIRTSGEECPPSSHIGRLLDKVGLERLPELRDRRTRGGRRKR